MTDLDDHPHASRFLTRVKGKNAANTYEIRERAVTEFVEFIDCHVPEVTYREIEDYLFHLNGQGYAEKTIRSRYDSLVQLFKFIAEKEEVVDTNPMDKITPKEYPSVFGKKGDTKKVKELRSTDGVVYLTPDEVERLAEHVPSRLPVRNELIIKLMFQTGMRPEEVRNLKFQHLDRETRRIQVWSNKTGDVREVTYTSSLDTLLYQWIDGGYRDRLSSAADSEYLFVSLKSDQMGQGNVNHVVKHAAENAGLQETMYNDAAGRSRAKITAHVLRHSFAVESLKNGMPLKMLSDVMGHASTDTTEIYLEVTREDTVEAMEKYGPGRM